MPTFLLDGDTSKNNNDNGQKQKSQMSFTSVSRDNKKIGV